jgi:superfamily II DNA or RNA helicase
VADDVVITNHNEAFIRIDCADDIAYELNDHFAFRVPGAEFSPKYRARLWNGMIYLFHRHTKQLYRGLVPYVEKFCKDRNYSFSYADEVFDEEISIQEAKEFCESIGVTLTPTDYQITAFVHAIRNRRSLLLSPTASGKSLIIYLIIRWILQTNDTKLLIVVPTTSLVAQLASDFGDYGFDSDNLIHSIYSGRDKHTDRRVVISTWQSLHTLPASYFAQYTAVIGDEAHLFKAKSLTHIMSSLTNARYRIGTTGTLDGTKTNKLVLEGLFGTVKKVTTTKELMDQKHIADLKIKCLLLKHSDEACKTAKNYTYQDEIQFLVLNEARNKFIRNLALSMEGNTLLLYQYVDKHGKILKSLIEEKATDRKVFFVYGKTDVEIREDTRRIVEDEKNAIIIASYGTFSTGMNLKNLNNIIFASPSKSRIRNLQSIGRGLRKSATKTSATLYDIADDLRYKKHENYTLGHFTHRIQIYTEEKFQFKVYKINLKGE